MDVEDVVSGAEGLATARTVYGEIFEKNGTMILPTAKVMGGAGGGSGEDPDKHQQGKGTGFGIRAKPTGVYVISDRGVSWKPAIDWNRIILGGQIVAVVMFLAARSMAKWHALVKMRAAKAG